MKHISIAAILILFVACKGGTGKTDKDTATAIGLQPIVNSGGTSIDSANESGSRMIAANDCLTCHQLDKKSFGPSYIQIANRYENNEGNVENLATKIIKGGKGLWSQNAMTPHPNLLRPQAEDMVRYILSLRNAQDTTK